MARPHPRSDPAAAGAAPGEPATGASSAAEAPQALAAGRRYCLARGFTYRREAFGGILYHYEGVRPDPRVTFVDNAFLLDLLDALQAHPDVPLADLCEAVTARFALGPAEQARVRDFFATLIARGALVDPELS